MPARAALSVQPRLDGMHPSGFHRGKLWGKRYILPLNEPGSVSNLGREANSLPYSDDEKASPGGSGQGLDSYQSQGRH